MANRCSLMLRNYICINSGGEIAFIWLSCSSFHKVCELLKCFGDIISWLNYCCPFRTACWMMIIIKLRVEWKCFIFYCCPLVAKILTKLPLKCSPLVHIWLVKARDWNSPTIYLTIEPGTAKGQFISRSLHLKLDINLLYFQFNAPHCCSIVYLCRMVYNVQ